MLHQISGSLFTLEEAKGHGLGADQGWRGKDWASPLPPHSEPWEGSGSRPGVLLQAQAGADLAGLTVEPSSCFLLCSGWMPGCRGLWLWECVAFPAAPRAVFSSSFAPRPHPRLPLWPRRLLWPASPASCRSAGLCSRPALPGRSPQAGAWQLELTRPAGSLSWRAWQTLVSSCEAPLGAPSWLLARFSRYLSPREELDRSLFLPYSCLLVLF